MQKSESAVAKFYLNLKCCKDERLRPCGPCGCYVRLVRSLLSKLTMIVQYPHSPPRALKDPCPTTYCSGLGLLLLLADQDQWRLLPGRCQWHGGHLACPIPAHLWALSLIVPCRPADHRDLKSLRSQKHDATMSTSEESGLPEPTQAAEDLQISRSRCSTVVITDACLKACCPYCGGSPACKLHGARGVGVAPTIQHAARHHADSSCGGSA